MMGKRKSADTISLDPKEQQKVSEEVENVKRKLKKGEISIKDERKAQKLTAEQTRGLIFISHLPHGFFEDELKGYFKQFGKVTNVKVCRSNRTGRSKGYGYVEFSHPEVAKIAGETMNNYLMFKKRLSVEYIPYEKRPKHLFHGKSSTTTKYSAKTRRNKQYQDNVVATDKKHSSRVKKRLSKFNKKLKKLSDAGVDIFPVGTSLNEIVDNNSANSSIAGSRMKLRKPNKLSEVEKDRSAKSKVPLDDSVNSAVHSLHKTKTHTSKIKKKIPTSKTSLKEPGKLASINAVTVKQIARELIRKKGPSLLRLQKATKKKLTTSKKK